MPLKMLRQNVLVDMGATRGPWESETIVCPDEYKRIDMIGVVVDRAGRCREIGAEAIGQRCLVRSFRSDDHMLTPKQSACLGLAPHWHFIVDESYIQMMLED